MILKITVKLLSIARDKCVSSGENLSTGFSIRVDSNLPVQLQKRGRSAPLLFAYMVKTGFLMMWLKWLQDLHFFFLFLFAFSGYIAVQN